MYERMGNDKVVEKLSRNTDPNVYNSITDKIASIDEYSTRQEIADIKKFIKDSKNKLSKEDYKIANEAFLDQKNIWNDAQIDKKYKEELLRQSRLSNSNTRYYENKIRKIEKMEQDISSYKNKETKARKYLEREKEKEKLIEEIAEENNLDAAEASDMYDRLLNNLRN